MVQEVLVRQVFQDKCSRQVFQTSVPKQVFQTSVPRQVFQTDKCSNMVQVLARQVLGGKCNMGNAVISVCSATPLGTHKENTEISPTETLQWFSNHQI